MPPTPMTRAVSPGIDLPWRMLWTAMAIGWAKPRTSPSNP